LELYKHIYYVTHKLNAFQLNFISTELSVIYSFPIINFQFARASKISNLLLAKVVCFFVASDFVAVAAAFDMQMSFACKSQTETHFAEAATTQLQPEQK